ncbi:MAG TPA: glycosyltransferase [Alphaproteobacteria bacterium]
MSKNRDNSYINHVIECAPPFYPIPAKGYGGTERVVDGIIKTFHDRARAGTLPITYELRAPGDSYADLQGDAKPVLSPTIQHSLGVTKPFEAQALMMTDMHLIRHLLRANPHAAAHIHIEDLHIPILGQDPQLAAQTLTTLHNPVKAWYHDYKYMPLVAISEAQKKLLGISDFDFVEVVHNGIDERLFTPEFDIGPDSPLTFLGRFSPDKNPEDAVKIALGADIPVKLAGPVDKQHPECLERIMQYQRQHGEGSVSYVGSVTDEYDPALGRSAKNAFLAASRGMLFPIKWAEPFGLVIAEANACGTPVIAFNAAGSAVPELIKNGVNGFIVNNVAEAIQAVKNLKYIDRRGVYVYFKEHFTSRAMGDKYMNILVEKLPAYRRSLRPLAFA